MIFIDSNIFLRHLVQPSDPATQRMSRQATDLFERAEQGKVVITTSEVVLHEVIFVLASKRHYALTPREIADLLRPLISMPSLRLPRGDKVVYQNALDLFVTYPELGFADSVIAARSLRSELELATFDTDFDQLSGLRRWPLQQE